MQCSAFPQGRILALNQTPAGALPSFTPADRARCTVARPQRSARATARPPRRPVSTAAGTAVGGV